jgi:hypothetical protein
MRSAKSGDDAHVNPFAWPFQFDETGAARGRPINIPENKARSKAEGSRDYSARYLVISSEGSEIEYRSSRLGSPEYLHVVLVAVKNMQQAVSTSFPLSIISTTHSLIFLSDMPCT